MAQLKQFRGHRSPVSTGCQVVMSHVAALVKLDGDLGLFTLGSEVGQQGLQYRNAFVPADLRHVQKPVTLWVFEMARRIVMHGETEVVEKRLYRLWVGHFQAQTKDVGRRALTTRECGAALDRDASFTIDEPSKVGQLYSVVHVVPPIRAHCMHDSTKGEGWGASCTKPGEVGGHPEQADQALWAIPSQAAQ